MRALFGCVLFRAAGGGRVRKRRHSVAVFAGVESKLVAGELAPLPPSVEGMLQDVPAPARCVQQIEELHQFTPPGSWTTPQGDATAWPIEVRLRR